MNNTNNVKVDNNNINTNKSRKKNCNSEPCNNNILEYYFNLPIKNKSLMTYTLLLVPMLQKTN